MGAVSNEDGMNGRIWTAALIVIGDEILSGRTQDKNVAQIASWLNIQGIRLKKCGSSPMTRRRSATALRALKDAPRLSVHHRRDRPDPRRHHGRFDRGGARPAGGGASRRPRDARALLCQPRRADRGAAADGAGAGRRRADPQPHVGRARHSARQSCSSLPGFRTSPRGCSMR